MKWVHILYSITLMGFTLGVFRGHLALWKDGAQEPLKIYSVWASAFPEADQKLLSEGIRAEDESELTSLLEDYLS